MFDVKRHLEGCCANIPLFGIIEVTFNVVQPYEHYHFKVMMSSAGYFVHRSMWFAAILGGFAFSALWVSPYKDARDLFDDGIYFVFAHEDFVSANLCFNWVARERKQKWWIWDAPNGEKFTDFVRIWQKRKRGGRGVREEETNGMLFIFLFSIFPRGKKSLIHGIEFCTMYDAASISYNVNLFSFLGKNRKRRSDIKWRNLRIPAFWINLTPSIVQVGSRRNIVNF